MKRPRLLLLDEPLSALDANLRRQMQVELKSLQREVGIAFVFVTHDQEEAMVMSDRIALLRMGELEQVATPREIYSRPATAYTAQFIGHTNLLRSRSQGGIVRCSSLSLAGAASGWSRSAFPASGKHPRRRNVRFPRRPCGFAGKITAPGISWRHRIAAGRMRGRAGVFGASGRHAATGRANCEFEF